jgi:hypothetical protein
MSATLEQSYMAMHSLLCEHEPILGNHDTNPSQNLLTQGLH